MITYYEGARFGKDERRKNGLEELEKELIGVGNGGSRR